MVLVIIIVTLYCGISTVLMAIAIYICYQLCIRVKKLESRENGKLEALNSIQRAMVIIQQQEINKDG